jgi:hypothetical protein
VSAVCGLAGGFSYARGVYHNSSTLVCSISDANLNLEVAVAAGNDGTDIGNSTPADVATAFAVGASDSTDSVASFSNYGSNLGAFAPGVDIISLWNNGETVSFPPPQTFKLQSPLSSTRSSLNQYSRIH